MTLWGICGGTPLTAKKTHETEVNADTSQHAGLLFGNDRADRWVATPALARIAA
jgi:hypothetical protein